MRLLDAVLNHEIEPNVKAWTAAAGIDRHTWYNWFKKPEFAEWFRTESERHHRGALGGVHASMLRTALAGETAAHRLYMERFDEGFKAKGEDIVRAPITLVLNQQVSVKTSGDDLLDDLAEAEKKS